MGPLRVYDRLVSQRPGKDSAKEYVLEAAQSVELPDPTTIVFKLRPGMKYHDRAPVSGRVVDSEDVVKTHIYIRDEPRATIKFFETLSMQSAATPDAQTVVFSLKQPNAYVFSGTQLCHPSASCIIPREMLDTLDTAVQIGSGPYTLDQYELGARYLYKRFDGFRDAARGLPYIAERELRIITDPAAQEAAFRSRQAHIWGYPAGAPLPTIAERVKKDLSDKIEADEYLNPALVTVAVNPNKPPFTDVRVREALYRILNRQQLVDLLEGGHGKVTPGPLPIPLTEYQLDAKQTEKYFRQDARAAKQLLDAAGFPYDREVQMANILGARQQQGGEIVQQQAAQVGMKIRVSSVPFPEWVTSVGRPDWEMWFSSHPPYDTPHLDLRFQHTDTLFAIKHTGLRDPEIDRMIDRSETTLDRAERVKLVKDVQLAALEKYTGFINTHSITTFLLRWKPVKDFELNPMYQPMSQVQMWLDE
jgi:peptide/nickel transport system substrate-binding protein